MDILLQLLMGPILAVACPQPDGINQLEQALYPIQTAEVCYVRLPKRTLPALLYIA